MRPTFLWVRARLRLARCGCFYKLYYTARRIATITQTTFPSATKEKERERERERETAAEMLISDLRETPHCLLPAVLLACLQ